MSSGDDVRIVRCDDSGYSVKEWKAFGCGAIIVCEAGGADVWGEFTLFCQVLLSEGAE